MASKIERFFEVYPAQPQATMPVGVRVNNMVSANGLAGIDPVTGEPAGDLVAQMTLIMEHLKGLMERAGGSLDNVVRCAAYVTTMEDREPIYGPWETLYPDPADRPGLKALLAELPEGHLVHLDAVGLIGGKRTRIDIPNIRARDPAVKMGNWFFTSRCHGNDQTTGDVVEGGLEAETRQTLENLATLVKLAGGSEESIVQLNMFGRDDSYKEVARRVFEERFPDPAKRPACHLLVNVVSGRMQIAIEMMAVLEGGPGPSGERFEELYLCSDKNSKPVGVRLGSFVFAPSLPPVDPCTGALKAKDLDGQIAATFDTIDTFLQSSGLGRDNVARVTFFMSDLSERIKLNPPWERWYPVPDDRPPHKYVPSAMPNGVLVSAQVMALADVPARKVLEVPGVVHNDPMSMGALTGNLVTSSRVVTGQRGDDLGEQTAMVFANVGALLKDAGGDYRNLTQVTAFIGDPQFRATVEKELAKVAGTGKDAPVLHVLETNLGGNGFPRLEVLGLM